MQTKPTVVAFSCLMVIGTLAEAYQYRFLESSEAVTYQSKTPKSTNITLGEKIPALS